MKPSEGPQEIFFWWSKYTYVYVSGYSKGYYCHHGCFWKIRNFRPNNSIFFYNWFWNLLNGPNIPIWVGRFLDMYFSLYYTIWKTLNFWLHSMEFALKFYKHLHREDHGSNTLPKMASFWNTESSPKQSTIFWKILNIDLKLFKVVGICISMSRKLFGNVF